MGRWKRFRAPKIATVIGKGTCIEGDLSFSGGLHLDGRVKGNLSADDGDERAVLVVSDMGLVEGDVRVPNVILNGKVIGDLFSSERVELASNARVTGTLHYKLMEMAIGAEVNGQLVYSESKEPRMLDYQGGEDGPPEGGDGSR
jgi:cytoskeletal protein CcmA (bactofilin family)